MPTELAITKAEKVVNPTDTAIWTGTQLAKAIQTEIDRLNLEKNRARLEAILAKSEPQIVSRNIHTQNTTGHADVTDGTYETLVK